ncbi:uracil-DNA glycosylase family protein [Methanogenium sp. MK-MG]|uniref:uracil-DNA glycosylase family protein n=1 Tax=Methanogenium sp. MK-MG TaxID=2599926 RepID=UPI0013EC3C86|nr:uracil-DNA glycosylase family protein [Methanogenium sp. MK-MG]KAF1078385.1 hypothetical protein MKMG_00720 [Methanogenium sp. MK-MG]
MSFDEHVKICMTMNKSDACPDECELKGLSDIPAVWVPPPQNHPFAGIIISRDPTTAFIPYYTDAKSRSLSLWRELLFDTNAIPRWTFTRIKSFNQRYMQGALSDEELNTFRDTLYHSVYWTHLHKCCTDKRGEASLKFRPRNAYSCADRWLCSEIESASRENIRFIVTLGKDVERWFERKGDDLVDQTIRLYHLPHPSGANMASWHPKDKQAQKRLEENIYHLVRECQEIL